MRAGVAFTWAVKGGLREDEYEDAAHPDQDAEPSGERLRFAIADGATECVFAGRWARALVARFPADTAPAEEFLTHLDGLRAEWDAWSAGQTLAWYTRANLENGVYAAFLGLEIRPAGRWCAVAVGDSCLAQVRQGKLLKSFPLVRSTEFGSRPVLLGTSRAQNGSGPVASNGPPGGRKRRDEWEPGDVFYLMTDALACWFLAAVEHGGHPWEALDALPTGPNRLPAFRELVLSLRQHGTIRNDDTSLLRVHIIEP